MYKLNLFARKTGILAMAFLEALVETLIIAVGIVFVGAFVVVALPVLSWIGAAVATKAKLERVR